VLPSALRYQPLIPDDWWSRELRLPEGTGPGSAARIVVSDPAMATDALVVSISEGGAFDAFALGMVAVPPGHADEIARAAANGAVTVLVSP
jgi:hypothetical protein